MVIDINNNTMEVTNSSSNVNDISTNEETTITTTCEYFAIGSMINPISIKLRGIHPIQSKPGELLNHHIGFFSSIGIAEPIEHSVVDTDTTNNNTTNKYKNMHGVIHTLSINDMKLLDTFELSNHTRVSVQAKLYDNTIITVFVYKRNKDSWNDNGTSTSSSTTGSTSTTSTDTDNNDSLSDDNNNNLPPFERYLELMIDGCVHYNVNNEYINYLRTYPNRSRPLPNEYLSFPNPSSSSVYLTIQDVIDNDGTNNKPLYMIINKKIISTITSDESSNKEIVSFINFRQQLGYYCELSISKLVYDPKYGIPNTINDVTQDHANYCEHTFCYYLHTRNLLQYFTTIAWLKE